MSRINLSSYSRETLEHILQIMKNYRISMKQVGNRAILLDPENLPEDVAIIEYAPSMDTTLVDRYARACLRFSFPEFKNTASPIIRKNPLLTGGVRVFVWDNMVDVSFARFESLVKK